MQVGGQVPIDADVLEAEAHEAIDGAGLKYRRHARGGEMSGDREVGSEWWQKTSPRAVPTSENFLPTCAARALPERSLSALPPRFGVR